MNTQEHYRLVQIDDAVRSALDDIFHGKIVQAHKTLEQARTQLFTWFNEDRKYQADLEQEMLDQIHRANQ